MMAIRQAKMLLQQTLRKRCGSARGGNSRECAEGQVSSELLMGARKKVERKEKKQGKGEI